MMQQEPRTQHDGLKGKQTSAKDAWAGGMILDDARKEREYRRYDLAARAKLLLITFYSWRTRGNNELCVESRRPRSGADNDRVACGRKGNRFRKSARVRQEGERLDGERQQGGGVPAPTLRSASAGGVAARDWGCG
eukprot:6207412-Pleurochrysis_carterae.AAC.5